MVFVSAEEDFINKMVDVLNIEDLCLLEDLIHLEDHILLGLLIHLGHILQQIHQEDVMLAPIGMINKNNVFHVQMVVSLVSHAITAHNVDQVTLTIDSLKDVPKIVEMV